ncbi:MAG: TonB-dependent receptor [Dysgonamonadaceae bacterium]|jgi:iron complex outermembrane receptor protein|nr:TonB-dependent receptor [Dysgonamonadaceae bacterium]
MRIGFIPAMLMLLSVLSVNAQEPDSVRIVCLDSVVVQGSFKKNVDKRSALPVNVLEKEFLQAHFTGNLVQTLAQVPGIRSMDIGAGFSKPVIRGMGFNRISVTENGIKQEGQQWGVDHGLEIDAFNAERVIIRKGPTSLLYGSDAMGGAIEIMQLPPPPNRHVFGEVVLLGKSVNETLGGSLMLGIQKEAWHAKFRYSEKHFGDYRIPVDTVVYLTQPLPVYRRRLKNTAGLERNISLYSEYRRGAYFSSYAVSDVYQKTGFFPGAHGIPDASRVQDDGDSRDVSMPYSQVNHWKMTAHHQYAWDGIIAYLDAGYQHNHREEWSKFHTHYGNQPAPETDPDKELDFRLNTYTVAGKVKLLHAANWEHTAGWDLQYQQNRIAGYAFLLPEYNRISTGLLWLTTYRPHRSLSVSGGIRYDYGRVNISACEDEYLNRYLGERGNPEETIAQYRWRSYPVNRRFGDVSGSLGLVWTPNDAHTLKGNIGHSFRLPGANELASNGVHHGTFRHEQGDPSLSSERGWQLDVSYVYDRKPFTLAVSPFVGRFDNYIYLRPTGEWSKLPHAGQIYRYTGARAVLAGMELAADVDLWQAFAYRFAGEYIHTYNLDEQVPLSFSPPASLRNTLSWKRENLRFHVEWQHIAPQRRVARNEDTTPGANLIHAGATVRIRLGGIRTEIGWLCQNLLNSRYYNHLSFYRKMEIPEPGRSFQLLIRNEF